jgi:hypothetical protein
MEDKKIIEPAINICLINMNVTSVKNFNDFKNDLLSVISEIATVSITQSDKKKLSIEISSAKPLNYIMVFDYTTKYFKASESALFILELKSYRTHNYGT